jgi:RHS repeat-associated protein
VLDEITYDSFGNVLSETNPAAGDRFKFTARELDAALSLYYYRARSYDPQAGRFLREDPLSFTAGDTNLYRYVFNVPIDSRDPLGMYDDDVHFYMTLYIALAIGLDECEGYVVAWANLYTDFNPNTWPLGLGERGVELRRRFHFRTSRNTVVRGAPECLEIAKKGIENCDGFLLGIGLHILQDSYSHEGYEPSTGHLKHRGLPDDPSRDVKKALEMAEQTYKILAEYAKTCFNIDPRVKWEDIKTKIERQFAQGVEEQKLGYNEQVAARVKRWRQLLEDDFKCRLVYEGNGHPDYWYKFFLDAANQVPLPKAK